MKKKDLKKRMNHFNESDVMCIVLLREFLVTDKIDKLELNDEVFFSDFLNYIQNAHPSVNPATFFKAPDLNEKNEEENKFMEEFISTEAQENSLMPFFRVTFNHQVIAGYTNDPATALAVTPEGNIIKGICYKISDSVKGKIILTDSNGKYIKTLAKEPASALALTSEGNIIIGTCYTTNYSQVKGKIVLRSADGKYIRTLAEEPASALVVTPEGNIISSTCYKTNNSNIKGEIVLRDSDGTRIQTLRNEPASALAMTPEGNIVTSTCNQKNNNSDPEGEIVLRKPNGELIATLAQAPASGLFITPNGDIISCSYSLYKSEINKYLYKIELRNSSGGDVMSLYEGSVIGTASALTLSPERDLIFSTSKKDYGRQKNYGVTAILRAKLVKEIPSNRTLVSKVEDLLIDCAALACGQFQKGSNEPESLVSMLPQEVLEMIYARVIPFQNKVASKIINPNCYPLATKSDVIKFSCADLFAKRISGFKFFDKSAINDNKMEKEDHVEESIENMGKEVKGNKLNRCIMM